MPCGGGVVGSLLDGVEQCGVESVHRGVGEIERAEPLTVGKPSLGAEVH